MKKTICAVAAALVLVLALLGVKNEYARLLPSGAYGMKPLIEAGSMEHVFLGSSLFRQGLDIHVLEEELGDSVCILSYNGNQPALMAMELEYLLEQGVEITNLYVDLYGYTAASEPWISDTKILLDTDLAFKLDTWELMQAYNDTKFLDFYELFVTANNEQILTWPIHNKLLSSQFYKGGTLIHSEGTTEEALDYTLGAREGIHVAQAEGFERIIELAQEHGIRLTFVETPKYVTMQEDEDYQMLMEQCLQAVSGQQVVTAQGVEFDHTSTQHYQDLLHLSSPGRENYTRGLCKALDEAK